MNIIKITLMVLIFINEFIPQAAGYWTEINLEMLVNYEYLTFLT